jgi:hypothetical protein
MQRLVSTMVTVIALGSLLLAGCSGGGGGNAVDVSGNFRGTLQDSRSGPGTATATLAQNGTAVSGTVQTSTGTNIGGGNATGTVSGNAIDLTVTPSQPTSCPFHVTGSVDGDTITGNFAAFNCTVSESGTFTLTRQ